MNRPLHWYIIICEGVFGLYKQNKSDPTMESVLGPAICSAV